MLDGEACPDSFNVYGSRSEGPTDRGDRELAIKDYEKSLELNPKNLAAATARERLEARKYNDGQPRPAGEQPLMVVAGTCEAVRSFPYRDQGVRLNATNAR